MRNLSKEIDIKAEYTLCESRFLNGEIAKNEKNLKKLNERLKEKGERMLNMNKNTVLQLFAEIVYASGVVAKSTTGRRKLNDLLMAKDSTPLNNRAFFVRSLRTPNENASSVLLSMVGRIGQPLAVGCVPLVAVSYPDTLYRQAVGSKAVDMKNLQMGLSQMLFDILPRLKAGDSY
ncbi:ash family protein [Histophilus somni]|uniref:ash family protein n=1 Tax=Histophilus somni TaxID=731 RepID=UPI003878143A